MLNKGGESGHPGLDPDVKGKFQLFTVEYKVILTYISGGG